MDAFSEGVAGALLADGFLARANLPDESALLNKSMLHVDAWDRQLDESDECRVNIMCFTCASGWRTLCTLSGSAWAKPPTADSQPSHLTVFFFVFFEPRNGKDFLNFNIAAAGVGDAVPIDPLDRSTGVSTACCAELEVVNIVL
eukprot:4605-Rhodomonas_salina.1